MENVSEIPVWSVEFITETLVLPMLACVMRRTYKNVSVDLSRLMINDGEIFCPEARFYYKRKILFHLLQNRKFQLFRNCSLFLLSLDTKETLCLKQFFQIYTLKVLLKIFLYPSIRH